MTTTIDNTQSFLDEAFEAVKSYKGYRGEIARWIESAAEAEAERRGLSSAGSIPEMFRLAFLLTLKDSERAYKPVQVVHAMQTVQDKTVWNAGSLKRADLVEEESTVDAPSIARNNAVEKSGVDARGSEIDKIINADYRTMTFMFSQLTNQLGFESTADLFFFNPSSLIAGTGKWEQRHTATTWEEAQAEMASVIEEMEERNAAERIAAIEAQIEEDQPSEEQVVAV